MYILKGFYEFPSLYNNLEHVIAPLGELSSNSRTYALDKTVHALSTYKHVNLISFHTIRDEELASVDVTYREVILNIGNYIYERAMDRTIGSNVNNFRQLINEEFDGQILNLTSGKMIFDGTIWMPEWIQYRVATTGEDNLIRIWMSDQAFAQQFDEYLIEIVHPIIPYDDFFRDPGWVRDKLKNYDIINKIREVTNVRREYPYTHLNAYEFLYTPPGHPEYNYPATWLAVIYGEAGNSLDLIKDKIMEDILSESNHTREEWEEILPELSKNPEIIFVPNFISYALETSDHRAGVYSPTVDPIKLLEMTKATVKGNRYTSTYIENNWEITTNVYKSLAMGCIGTSDVNSIQLKMSTKFPDYILATMGNPDTNRVDPETLNWMNLFTGLIKAAEELDAYNSVPFGYFRVMRENIIYAGFDFNNVNYLMVTKHSIEELDV